MPTSQIFKIFIALFFVSPILSAQNIKGAITDENEQPIENAYIYNTNSSSHAHSLSNGTFILENNIVERFMVFLANCADLVGERIAQSCISVFKKYTNKKEQTYALHTSSMYVMSASWN